mgnify:FL=1
MISVESVGSDTVVGVGVGAAPLEAGVGTRRVMASPLGTIRLAVMRARVTRAHSAGVAGNRGQTVQIVTLKHVKISNK